MQIHKFTFNPFDENTYIVYDDTGSVSSLTRLLYA